jgi:hypothetical protein
MRYNSKSWYLNRFSHLAKGVEEVTGVEGTEQQTVHARIFSDVRIADEPSREATTSVKRLCSWHWGSMYSSKHDHQGYWQKQPLGRIEGHH